MKQLKKIYMGGAIICLSLLFFTASFIFSTSAQQNKNIDASDLTQAGFTNPVRQTMDIELDTQQVVLKYFKVQESVISTNPEWGAAADLVAVLIRVMPQKDWKYNDGEMEIINYDGRRQARLGKDGYYIVVTGPDQEKVVNLTNNLFNK